MIFKTIRYLSYVGVIHELLLGWLLFNRVNVTALPSLRPEHVTVWARNSGHIFFLIEFVGFLSAVSNPPM